jgi:ABC-2 type transport system permease protein
MGPARVLRAYLMEAKLEFVRMTRAPIFVIPMLLLPPMLYYLVGVLIVGSPESHTPPAISNVLYSGFAVFAVLGPALFGVGCSLAVERDQGLMRLKRAMPVPTGAYLIAKVLMAMGFAALAAGSIAVVALLAGKLTLSVAQVAAITAALVAGVLPCCAIGLFIGTRVSGAAAPGVTNLVYFPMIYLAGLFFPLPHTLRQWSVIWPTFHLNRVALAAAHLAVPASVEPHVDPGVSLAVLVAVTVVFGGLALRRLARAG